MQGTTAECRTCSNGCTLSHFQILMNSAAVNRLFHGAGAAGAAMDLVKGAGCRNRVPRCRVPMQSTEVRGAAAGYRGAGCRCRVSWYRAPLRSTGVQGVAAEYRGAGCRCRVPMCRERVRNNKSCRGCKVLLLNAACRVPSLKIWLKIFHCDVIIPKSSGANSVWDRFDYFTSL